MDSHADDGGDLVQFDRSLHIGLPAVDKQHGALIGELNRLIAAPAALPSSDLFTDVLSRLGRELGAHFRFEESLFPGLGMHQDEIDTHVAAHQEILSQYVDLNLDMMHSRTRSRADVLVMVRNWVMEHIVVHDLRMRAYLAA